jgi:hypothetical protein
MNRQEHVRWYHGVDSSDEKKHISDTCNRDFDMASKEALIELVLAHDSTSDAYALHGLSPFGLALRLWRKSDMSADEVIAIVSLLP